MYIWMCLLSGKQREGFSSSVAHNPTVNVHTWERYQQQYTENGTLDTVHA